MRQLDGYIFMNQEGLAWNERLEKWVPIDEATTYSEEGAEDIIAKQKNECYVPHSGDFELITKSKAVKVGVYIFIETMPEAGF